MTKINRRDYLIGMGAAAGAMATLPAAAVLGQPEISAHVDVNSGPSPSPQSDLLNWVTTPDAPSPDSFVTAIFWGLMGFSYKVPAVGEPPVVEVGVHPGGNHHTFKITVVEIGSTTKVICEDRPSKIKKMRLKVVSQAAAPPKVYQKDNDPFDREKGDPLDFRWLPDLDGLDFYPDPCDKNKPFGPRLVVDNGVFYTRMRTESKFKLVRVKDDKDLRKFGHVARFMAAAFEVQNPNDYVSFEINDLDPCLLKQKPGVKYQIIFQNECYQHPSCPSDSTINDPDEKKRNHFHYMREVLKLDNRIKYGLKISQRATAARLNFFNPDSEEKAFVTDEAPCAGAAFGQANGFPT